MIIPGGDIMKGIKIFLVLAGVAFIISIFLRVAHPFLSALPIIPMEPPLEPHSFLYFADTCLLFAIALGIFQLLKKG